MGRLLFGVLLVFIFTAELSSEDGVPAYDVESRAVKAVYEAFLTSGSSSNANVVDYQDSDVSFYRERVPSPKRDEFLLQSVVDSYESNSPDTFRNKPLAESKYFAVSHQLEEDDLYVRYEGMTFVMMSDRLNR